MQSAHNSTIQYTHQAMHPTGQAAAYQTAHPTGQAAAHQTAEQKQAAIHGIMNEVSKAIVGKSSVIIRVLLAILARGHILIEDIPGVGKTTLAIAFSKALNLEYSRVQFTPDVLPSDITGYSIFDKNSGEMKYTPGAVMCNLFLADELNRATSRTQSALLEAMEEGQVTVDGESYKIREPFIVMATQNPVGAAGTQLLPDSQLDRFMIRLSIGYPSHQDELSLIERKKGRSLVDLVKPVLSGNQLMYMCSEVDKIHVHPEILEYIVKIVGQTRNHRDLQLGASPRASLSLTAMSKAAAYCHGRDYVVPNDLQQIIVETLAHRLVLKPDAINEGKTAEGILKSVMSYVHVPRIS